MCLVILFTGVSLLTSCTTIVRSEAELYFRKHPEARSRYARFSPTDAETVEDCAWRIYRTRLNSVEARKREGADPEHIEDMTRMAGQWHQEDRKLAASLRDAAKRTGGQIYRYEIQSIPHGEGGYLVIRDGEIVQRIGVTTWTNRE
jgi:hypothetical protein